MEKELEIISQTFDDNFTLNEIEQVTIEDNKNVTYEPDVPNVVLDNNAAPNLCESEDFDLYCYPTCKYGRKHDRSMIQCCICMLWYHCQCTTVSSEHTGIWNCKKCRCIPQAIDHVTDQMNEMNNLLSNMVEKQNELYQQLFSDEHKKL